MNSSEQCTYYLAGTFTATAGHWVTNSIQVSCDSGGGGGNTNTSPNSNTNNHGGNTSGSTSTTPNTNCRTCPVLDENNIESEIDPCEKITNKIADANFISKMAILRSKTGLQHETGFSENANGSFNPISPSTNGHSLNSHIGLNSNIKSVMHAHLDDFSKDLNGDGILDYIQPIRIFSPRDIKTLLSIAYYSTNPNNTYTQSDTSVFMTSSDGEYFLEFTGNIQDINGNATLMNLNKIQMDKLNNKFRKKVRRPNNVEKQERNFLRFINRYIGINGIRLFKLNTDNTIDEVKLDNNNNRTTTPC